MAYGYHVGNTDITLNSDLIGALKRLKGTVKKTFEKMGDLIYKYGWL